MGATADPIVYQVRFGAKHEKLGDAFEGVVLLTNTGDGGFLISGLLDTTKFDDTDRNWVLGLAACLGASHAKMKRVKVIDGKPVELWFHYDLLTDEFPCTRIS